MPRPRTTPPNPSTDDPPADGTQTDLVRAAIDVFIPDFDNLNLHQKIAKITGMIGGVEKRGYNAFHKYHYVLEADLVGVVRQYLAAAGIIIIPNAHKWEYHGEVCMVDVEYIVSDGNESFTFSMPGAGADRGDKGVYKAITGSNKYALMKLFKIETGDDPEGDTRVDERAATSEQRPDTVIRGGSRAGIQRGAHTDLASPTQLRRIASLQKEQDLSREELAKLIETASGTTLILPDDEIGAGRMILETLKVQTAEVAGIIILALEARAGDVDPDSAGVPYG